MRKPAEIVELITASHNMGGLELATTRSFINGLCHLLDVACTYSCRRNSTLRLVLDALAGIAMARRLKNGRYVA